jgi:endonuclease/exonuclease/phosphatase family metal-dependent hydrolase
VLLGVGSTQATLARNGEVDNGDRVVRIMTRNVYHGVGPELDAVASATNFSDFLTKAAAVYQGYHTRNFPERASALAAEIDAARPDLVGLQEAVLIRTQSPADGPATPATTVDLDFVEILLDALAARGLRYEIVVQVAGWDIEVPTALGFDLRHTDREVILARVGKAAHLKLSNAQGGNFVANCTFPTAVLGAITIRRSWVSVDAELKGEAFRMVSTHLDGDCLPITPAFQRAQAKELLAGPAATDLPLLLIGDLNSPGDGTGLTYNDLMTASFSDAWTLAGSGPDLTCCEAGDLLNVVSTLNRRIDFVLFRGELTALRTDTVGHDPSAKTPSGMWPSDHAGVVAVLQVPKSRHHGRR